MRARKAGLQNIPQPSSVSKSGALAPEWRFGTSLGRQKFSQTLRKKVNFRLFGKKSWESIKMNFFPQVFSYYGKNCHIKMQ